MTKVIVATTNEDFAVRLGSSLADLNGDLRRVDYLPDEHAPPPRGTQVVFLGPGFETEEVLETASWIDRAHPGMRVIIVAEPEPDLLHAALRVGARDVLPADAEGPELKRAYATALEAARPGSDGDPSERSRVITVASPKGGTGKTVIASNLAMGLASHHPQKVVLVDLDLLFGDVSNALMLIPEHTLADVARAKNLDGTTLKIYLTPHKGSLFALCAPETPVDAEAVTPEQIPSILELLASEFDYVVIDTAGGLDDATLFALDASTDIVLVTNMDVPSVRGARKFIDIARGLGLMHRRVHVVLNRADSRVGIELEDVSATIGAQVDVAIPSSRLVPVALNSGEPLIESNPRSPVGRKITELVERFSEVPATGSSPSFFRRSGR
jgi:pilus assembly protein CpaE